MTAILNAIASLSLDHLPQRVDFQELQGAMLHKIRSGGAIAPTHETHHFVVPGFYVRQWRGARGTLVFTPIHKQRHSFQVTRGRAVVWTPESDRQTIEAPHVGITEPGTQRLLLVLDDIVWTTFHANEDGETDVAVLESRLATIPEALPA